VNNNNWHVDKAFCDWLVGAQYATRTWTKKCGQKKRTETVKPIIGLGLVLYMYEAYQLGKTQQEKKT